MLYRYVPLRCLCLHVFYVARFLAHFFGPKFSYKAWSSYKTALCLWVLVLNLHNRATYTHRREKRLLSKMHTNRNTSEISGDRQALAKLKTKTQIWEITTPTQNPKRNGGEEALRTKVSINVKVRMLSSANIRGIRSKDFQWKRRDIPNELNQQSQCSCIKIKMIKWWFHQMPRSLSLKPRSAL